MVQADNVQAQEVQVVPKYRADVELDLKAIGDGRRCVRHVTAMYMGEFISCSASMLYILGDIALSCRPDTDENGNDVLIYEGEEQ